MAHNPFIFKQFVKTFVTSVEFFEATFKIAESVANSQTYIRETDKLKQKIEDKTGIHINRHNEKESEKCLSHDDPRLEEIIKEFKITEESVSRRLAADIKAEKEAEREGLIPAIIINIIVWSLLLKMISGLF